MSINKKSIVPSEDTDQINMLSNSVAYFSKDMKSHENMDKFKSLKPDDSLE